MPAQRPITHRDGASRIADPANFPGLARNRRPADSTEDTIVRIYQASLASAITAAAAKAAVAQRGTR